MYAKPDTALVQLAQQGDTEAIETLLLQCHPLVLRYAQRHCSTAQDAEDAVQEALWIAARKLKALRNTGAFVAWLFRIARNHCFTLLFAVRYEDVFGEPPATLRAIEADDGQTTLRHTLADAIALLPLAYREVVIMRDIQEMSGAEVAAALDLTLPTIKSRLHRGRELLRETLRDWVD